MRHGVEKGCFWTTFRATGRGDAPDRANLEKPPTEFSSGPNGRLGGPNGAFPSGPVAAPRRVFRLPGPATEPTENRPLKPTDTGSGRGWERGSPGHPRILRKTICIFQPCTSFPYKKLDISQSFGKTSKPFRDIFEDSLNICAIMFRKRFFEQILLKMFSKNSCGIFQQKCVRERFSQHKSPRPRPPKHAAGPRAT